MEKVVYALTTPAGSAGGQVARDLLDIAGPALVDGGARGVQINVVDEAVTKAQRHRIASSDQPADAVVSVWLHSATAHLRAWADDLVAVHAGHLSAYLVTESVPLPNTRFPHAAGSRAEGFSQLAFLRRPAHLAHDEWLRRWLDDHTQVALDTQDTFLYVQNVVVRPLTPDAPPWHGIVEECFPAPAMTDQHAFFDAIGDDARLRRNQTAMFESCARFLDVSQIDVLPTSRYVLLAP